MRVRLIADPSLSLARQSSALDATTTCRTRATVRPREAGPAEPRVRCTGSAG